MKEIAIFDLDGTLINSMWVWESLLIDFLNKYHLRPSEHLLNEVTHMSLVQSSAFVQKHFNLPQSAEEIHQEWVETAAHAYAEKIELKDGAYEYLLQLKKQGIRLGIATSCDRHLCESCLKNNGIWDYFDAITYADEVGKGKNHPDIYLESLQRLRGDVKKAVLFEDILVAMRTAHSIGLDTVIVQDSSAEPGLGYIKKRI